MPRPLLVGLPGGVRVPVPRWTLTFFGLLAIAALSFGVYRHFYPVVPELITVQQANDALRLEVAHYNLHIVDAPIASLEDDINHQTAGMLGHVVVRVFGDGCLLVSRRLGEASVTRLLVDVRPSSPRSATGIVPVVHAAEQRAPVCLNPHPGRFAVFYGQKLPDGCWLPVTRMFEDGCVHVQMFNACSGMWATNRDGSPQVRWTRCVH